MASRNTLADELGSDSDLLASYTLPKLFEEEDPMPIHKMQPVLELYRNAANAEVCRWNDLGLVKEWLSKHDPKDNKVAIIIHGFESKASSKWMIDMKDALMCHGGLDTVVLVDWRNGADLFPTDYNKAVANVKVVGEWLGGIVKSLKDEFQSIYFHGIGHSLGAHVLGFAGRKSGSFNRITGLDPAGPMYETECSRDRLQKTDASDMVDIIHTDGYDPDGYYPVNHFGTLIPLGTIDFYPNYGLAPQPGCSWSNCLKDWHLCIGASHQRSHDLFNWSISNRSGFLTALRLKNTPFYEHVDKETIVSSVQAQMGYYANLAPATTGNFYIHTTDKAPWELSVPTSGT